ncbi:hypothetical protein KUCAC02_027355 [Chaenocephalus aceratus]|uniref:Uncharacterized protein n=1 Tax=Chaenocephalus aceratus TaxID=36190 RepID=A0ACB9W3G9_CHAAC|nr:hypothetical protein KUCAC02_027355 [Chaenocephalus aceratus]
MPPRGEDNVSLSQVCELLKQQQDAYGQLLTQQENNSKSFIQILVDSTNKRMDDMNREAQDLKNSLQFSQKEVDELKETCKELKKKSQEARTDISTVRESVITMSGKSDYLEGQSKRKNLIIDGIPESAGESWEESEYKVRELLRTELQMDEERIEVERAHRMGNGRGADKPRQIVVKFLHFKDKTAVMGRRNRLKGTNIFLNEDYPEAVRQKRKELIPAMKAERSKGNIAYIRYDRLIVHPPQTPPIPRSPPPKGLRERTHATHLRGLRKGTKETEGHLVKDRCCVLFKDVFAGWMLSDRDCSLETILWWIEGLFILPPPPCCTHINPEVIA